MLNYKSYKFIVFVKKIIYRYLIISINLEIYMEDLNPHYLNNND